MPNTEPTAAAAFFQVNVPDYTAMTPGEIAACLRPSYRSLGHDEARGVWNTEANPSIDVMIHNYAMAAARQKVATGSWGREKFRLNLEGQVLSIIDRGVVQEWPEAGSNTYLSPLHMPGMDLRDARLAGARFAGATLMGADMQGADVSGANFTGACLNSADMRRVTAKERAYFIGTTLQHANLEWAELPGSCFGRADFEQASLKHAQLQGADLIDTRFFCADAYGVDFTNTKLKGSSFISTNLRDALIDTGSFHQDGGMAFAYGATKHEWSRGAFYLTSDGDYPVVLYAGKGYLPADWVKKRFEEVNDQPGAYLPFVEKELPAFLHVLKKHAWENPDNATRALNFLASQYGRSNDPSLAALFGGPKVIAFKPGG